MKKTIVKDSKETRAILQILRRMALTKVVKSKKIYNRKNKSWKHLQF